ncbi:unnamed protein product [Timema podura]|uniref:C2H2-type domain-containing protein n=1 Tax=Timema podura TaxID=61482 RepID=A0ABN7P6E6_TIMPD|nr:unnamed protein product [Timema podura]
MFGGGGRMKNKSRWIMVTPRDRSRVGAQHALNMEQYVYNETLLPYCFESSLKEEPSKQVLLSTDKSVTEKNMIFQDGDPQTKNVSPVTEINGQDNTIHEHYQCHHCGNTFRKRKVLTSHIRMSCKNVPKTVKCDHCSSYFKSTDALKKHAVIHNEHKPFHCDVCEKSFFKLSFKIKRILDKHIQIHNGVRFKCEMCGQSYSRKNYLSKHAKSHTK